MNTVHDARNAPPGLLDYLKASEGRLVFRRKVVLVKDVIHKQWSMLGLVLSPESKGASSQAVTYRYADAVLLSDVMTSGDILSFFREATEGQVTIGGEQVLVTQTPAPGCDITHVPVQNYWMEQAGTVYSIRWHGELNAPHYQRLLAPKAPYYPNAFEAAAHWLGLRQYHGSSDSSKGCMLVLAPESKAYISGTMWAAEDRLEIQVEGSLVGSGELSIVGAWWDERTIHHIQCAVIDGSACLTLPRNASRLELFIIDAEGDVFDFRTETLGIPQAASSSLLAMRNAGAEPDRLLKAIAEGEGERTEFKEFVDLPRGKEPLADKDKFMQVLRTAAAFANTAGGTLYVGVSDDCEIAGVDQGVSRWVSGKPSADALESYTGALRTKVREGLYPSVDLRTSTIAHDGRTVVTLEVKRSAVPVSVAQEHRLYERRSASNRKMEPADWRPPQGEPFSAA